MKKILLPILLLVTTFILVGCNNNIEAVSLVVTPNEININVGSELKIDVSVLPADTTNQDLQYNISDKTVASVNDQGIVSGLKVGQTTLTITVKKTTSFFKEVVVNVIDLSWPNDEIEAHYNFTLPKFPIYTSLTINHLEENVLEIIIMGYNDEHTVMNDYNLLLINDGWVANNHNDSHHGSYTKAGIDVIVSYHSSHSHGTESIEFKITPK